MLVKIEAKCYGGEKIYVGLPQKMVNTNIIFTLDIGSYLKIAKIKNLSNGRLKQSPNIFYWPIKYVMDDNQREIKITSIGLSRQSKLSSAIAIYIESQDLFLPVTFFFRVILNYVNEIRVEGAKKFSFKQNLRYCKRRKVSMCLKQNEMH